VIVTGAPAGVAPTSRAPDAIGSGAVAIAPRPGPAPACTDAELLAVALVRRLLGRRCEAGFLAEVARDWAHLFPRLPR
jgi:hypothetical protein